MQAKKRNPYGVFMWGALLMAVVCFGMAARRIGDHRPARADGYTIAGILGLLSAAAAWSLGAAHERSRRNQEDLRASIDGLQERMQALPRALMEDSVKVAQQERQERRTDQERQAGELRRALEEGVRTGFAPIAPTLSEHIATALGSLSDSLRSDREERTQSLNGLAQTVSQLQTFQKEWSQNSSALLEKLRERGTALQKEISERDTSWRAGLEKLSQESVVRFQEAVESHLAKTRPILEGLAKNGNDQAASAIAKMESAAASISETSRAALENLLKETRSELSRSTEQAEAWLEKLSAAAENMREAAQGARSVGDTALENQAGLKAAVETLNQGLTGMVDRLQSLAAVAQGHEALLGKMETVIQRFEERAVEMLEDNALKIQENFLDALDRVETGVSKTA
jgi:hypothetical protein